jgi:trk system potassium uptake protein TrkH
MTAALGCCLIYREPSYIIFIKSITITVAASLLSIFIFKTPRTDHINHKEGMVIVALAWLSIGFFGAFPFYFEGETFTNAFFESVSGFTTTGASILTDIEAKSKGLLFWRSLIQWIGGMGIIVLSIAILPFLGVGGMELYKAEVPSPVPDKLKPRIKDTAIILWTAYLLLTALEAFLLMLAGMSVYDAICHAFTTMPTGGFSVKNASVGYYNSIYIDYIIIIFMFLAGINFSLHFQLIRGKTLIFWRDAECRFYIIITLALIGVLFFFIYGSAYQNIDDALRYAAFQAVSIITTTGFATADYELWVPGANILLLFSMFLGASAGSTGGGMKSLRIMLCFKYCYREIFSLIHPRSVSRIKIGGKTVSDKIIRSVLGFLSLYVGIFALCAILLSAIGVDFTTSIGAAASALGNIGPGFGLVGPAENYAAIPEAGKWLLLLCMLLGRLEIYTIIVLFIPEFWRR